MFVKNISLLVLLFGVSNVVSKGQKIPCALEDSECTTSAANPLFKDLVNGRPDIGVPTSDPLHQDVIHGFVPDMNYILSDAYLYGMRDCNVEKHSLNLQRLTWSFIINCPKLILESNYETIGLIAGNYIEGKGRCRIVHENYHISMHGEFEIATAANGKPHFLIRNFEFNHLEVFGNVQYQFENLYYGDAVKSHFMHKYLNDNWKTVSSYAHYPMMYSFMGKMFEHLNIFLAVVPADEIFFRTV